MMLLYMMTPVVRERVVNVVALLMILAKDSYTIAAFLIVCYIAVVSDKFQKTLSLEKNVTFVLVACLQHLKQKMRKLHNVL